MGQDTPSDFGPSDFRSCKIGIAGMGLIGASLSMALGRAGFNVTGFDTDKSVVRLVNQRRMASSCFATPRGILDADFIFVALYPEAAVQFIENHSQNFKKGAVIVDCCGVKTGVCQRAEKAAQRNGFFFIGGHPMAGKERSGAREAAPDLFCGASFILTPKGGCEAQIKKLKTILRAAGFAKFIRTTPKNHDRIIAFTSQLPHVVACALANNISLSEHAGYTAGSFRDITRVAHSNAVLWSELLTENSEMLCGEIDRLVLNLNEIRDVVARSDSDGLSKILNRACHLKEKSLNA
jgi:prephenate dehydrogenase